MAAMEWGLVDPKDQGHMNEAAVVRRFRASLIGNADDSAGWRYRKARTFPWDTRNVESAKSLRRLCTALTQLSADNELWNRYAELWSSATDDDSLRLGEMEHEMLRAYGFSIHGASGSAEKFLSELVLALQLEVLDPRSAGPAELARGARQPPDDRPAGRSPHEARTSSRAQDPRRESPGH
jgi:hypothetical protein